MKHTLLIIASALLLTPCLKGVAQTELFRGDRTLLIDNSLGQLSVNRDAALTNSGDSATANASSIVYSPYRPKAQLYNHTEAAIKVSLKNDTVNAGKPYQKVMQKWYFEIPGSMMGRLFEAVTRIAENPPVFYYNSHQEVAEGIYSFELSPDKKNVLLKSIREVYNYSQTDDISKAVDLSSVNPYVMCFKVDTCYNDTFKIEVSNLIYDDKMMTLHKDIKKRHQLSGIDRERSYVASLHSYPENLEIHTLRTYMSPGEPNSATRNGVVTVGLNTSLVLLPKEPMQMRLADPRVGFDNIEITQFSDSKQKVDVLRPILRWRLEPKSEADAQLQQAGTAIEPKKPIVYYLDPAFPEKWRPYIKEGVAEWQKAFEQAGWKNAIYALDWPANDSLISMEDARFNVIRFIPEDTHLIYGSNRPFDYRSGEMINSCILFYQGVLQYERNKYIGDCGAVDADSHTAVFPDHLMGKIIRSKIARAVAPTLGLAQNLLASALTPTDSLRSKSFIDKYSLAPSITDELPYNFVAQPEDGLTADQLIPRVSDGDEWTIAWGYGPTAYTDAESESLYLTNLTTDHIKANPRHLYTPIPRNDPQVKIDDLGDDQALAIRYGLNNLKRITPHLVEWGLTEKDMYYHNLNAQNYWARINGKFLEYYVILANNITGKAQRMKPASEDGPVHFSLDKEHVEKCIEVFMEMCGTQQTWMYADTIQHFTSTTQDRTAMAYAQYMSGAVAIPILANLNKHIDPLEYAQRISNACLAQAKPGIKPDSYNRALQALLVSQMISNCQNKSAESLYPNAAEFRSISRHIIDSTYKKLKAAQAAATDAETRDHYTMLIQQIDQYYSI